MSDVWRFKYLNCINNNNNNYVSQEGCYLCEFDTGMDNYLQIKFPISSIIKKIEYVLITFINEKMNYFERVLVFVITLHDVFAEE